MESSHQHDKHAKLCSSVAVLTAHAQYTVTHVLHSIVHAHVQYVIVQFRVSLLYVRVHVIEQQSVMTDH